MTQIKYKLTDQNLRTYKGFQWVVGEWVEAPGELDQSLCSDAWIHFYDDPLLAVFFNPIHADIDNPRLWEMEIDGDTKMDATKGGARRARLLRELPLSLISLSQRVEIAIRCVLTVYSEPNFVIWAEKWLNGTTRTKAAAAEAAKAAMWAAKAWTWAEAAAWSATRAAEEAEAWSETKAAEAAEAEAAYSAAAAGAEAAYAAAAEAAMWAAKAAKAAEAEAWSATRAAQEAAAQAHQVLDILAVIKQVVG